MITLLRLCNGLKQHCSYCIRLNCLRFLACPARLARRYFVFKRATYALEEFVAAGKSNKFSDLHV